MKKDKKAHGILKEILVQHGKEERTTTTSLVVNIIYSAHEECC